MCYLYLVIIYPSKEGGMSASSQERNRQKVREMLFLSVAYAASCGGVGTLTGTGPNLVLKVKDSRLLLLLAINACIISRA